MPIKSIARLAPHLIALAMSAASCISCNYFWYTSDRLNYLINKSSNEVFFILFALPFILVLWVPLIFLIIPTLIAKASAAIARSYFGEVVCFSRNRTLSWLFLGFECIIFQFLICIVEYRVEIAHFAATPYFTFGIYYYFRPHLIVTAIYVALTFLNAYIVSRRLRPAITQAPLPNN